MRKCGECSACCKILPTAEIDKPANTRCQHQRFGKGCAIYDKRPISCRLWSCAWLVGEDTENLSRPDRSHYVIDILPDFVTLRYPDVPDRKVPVIQVWLDPKHPDAHTDPALRAYIEKLGCMALIRTGSYEAFVICPPKLAHDGQWHEERTNIESKGEHTMREIMEVIG